MNVTIERKDRKDAKKRQYFLAAFAPAKPKLAESLASEGWAFAFNGGVGYSDALLATVDVYRVPSGDVVVVAAGRLYLSNQASR